MRTLRDCVFEAYEKFKESTSLSEVYRHQVFVGQNNIGGRNHPFVWEFRLNFLEDVEKIRYRAVLRKQRIFREDWNALFEEGKKLKNVYTYSGKGRKRIRSLNFSNGGISSYQQELTPSSIYYYCVKKDEEFPLLMCREDLHPTIMDYVKKRVVGTEKKWEYSPSILNRYSKIERDLKRCRRAIGICDTILSTYVKRKYNTDFMSWADPIRILFLTINKRKYIFKLCNELECLSYPENDMIEETIG